MNSDLVIDEYMIEIENDSKKSKLPKIITQQKFTSWATDNSNNFMDEVD